MNFYFSNPYLSFYTPVVLALIVARIPKVGLVFRTTNTFLHETGHALMALLFSGQVVRIKLNTDSSGEAATTAQYWVAKVCISLAGYTSSALAAWGVFFLVSHKQYAVLFIILLILAVIHLIFWIRNTYGVLWIIGFSILCAGLIYMKQPQLDKFFGIFIGASLLIENMISTLTLLQLSFKKPKQSGDASNLQKNTYIPSCIWAIIFTAFSAYIIYLIVVKYFPF